LSELNLHNIVRVATEGNLTPLYIGFNAQFNDQVITLFDNGIAQLKTDGKLQRILNQYNTEPWYDTKHL
jgi:ABC-type amino acid transport substrate-binding protein